MRFQSMYVDMRPVMTKWLGVLSTLLFFVLLYYSLKPDIAHAVTNASNIYAGQNQAVAHGQGINYLRKCLFESGCLSKISLHWTASLPLKAFVIGGIFFGLLSAGFGMWWRPEIMANRDIRVNSARVDQSRETSPTAPKGLV